MKDEREKIRKELEELSPLLAKMKDSRKTEGFEVPPAYFREFPDQLMRRLREEERLAASQMPWQQALIDKLASFFQPRYAIGLATVAVLVIAGLFFFIPTDTPRSSSNIFNTLTAEEVNFYIQSNLHEFEAEMVMELAEKYQEELPLLPDATLEEEDLEEEYYEELLRELDEKSIEELL